jgi:cytidyltransferase-like protein
MSESVGVIHGRFQPLHLGHLEYLLAGKERCEVLVVGITNPDPWQTGFEPSDPSRSSAASNPFTFYERYLMVEGAMDEAGVARTEVRIVPFPHNHPERIGHYAPPDALYLLSIYDDWGETKLRRLSDLGLRTHVLWRRDAKVTTGSEVRRRITEDEPWSHLVPEATRRVIVELGLDRRIRSAHLAGRD